MLKTPRNLTVPLCTYMKRLEKELVHFSWSIIKTSYISMEHREYGTFGATVGGDITLLHIGLRGQRLPHSSKRDFLEARTHNEARRVNVSVEKSDAECLQGLCEWICWACMGLCLQHTNCVHRR